MAKKDRKGKRGRKVAVTPSYPTYAAKPKAEPAHPPKSAPEPKRAPDPAPVAAAAAPDPSPVPIQVALSAVPATLPLAVEVTALPATIPLTVEVQGAPVTLSVETTGSTAPDRPRVSVMGTGRVERAADIARATFVVEATRHTAAEARAIAAGTASDVLAALAGVGVDRADINTAGLDVSPNWEHDGNRPIRQGFTVTNRIAVVVRDLEAVGRVLDAALEAGATGLDGVSFQLADTSGDATEARRRAVADARERAGTIAAAAGMTLGRLVGIAEAGAPVPMPRGPMRMAAFAMDAAPPTPVVPGAVEVAVSVSAEWELVEG